MMPDNSPAPLDYQLSSPVVRYQSPLIRGTWSRMAQHLAERGLNGNTIYNMREAFVSGLYAASAAITNEHADAQTISEEAYRIEKQR